MIEFIIFVLITIWFGLGYAARCYLKYLKIKEFIDAHPKEFPSRELLSRRDLYDLYKTPAIQEAAWRSHHEILGIFVLLLGLVGFSGMLTYALMEPLDNGELDIRFLF